MFGMLRKTGSVGVKGVVNGRGEDFVNTFLLDLNWTDFSSVRKLGLKKKRV